MTTRQINIIPANYQGNPHDAKGYPWAEHVPVRDSWTEEQKAASPWSGFEADRSLSTPGEDLTGGINDYRNLRKKFESEGLVCIDSDNIRAIMDLPKDKILVARVTCMWCGGASFVAYRVPSAHDSITDITPGNQNPGEESHETSAIVKADEQFYLAGIDQENKNHPGWCNRCHSYCYGDCQS